MAIKMDGHTITELELCASDGTTTTKQLTEEGVIPTPSGKKSITDLNETDVTNYASAQVSDEHLLAGNIKKNITILGVTGSYEGSGSGTLPILTNPASASDILLGKEAIDDSAQKIVGTCTFDADTSDANAVASDIAQGKTAYVNGQKVTGTNTGGGGGGFPDEYVSNGLLARYDAIENTRNGHDANATTWEDLSGNGYDLSLTKGVAPIVGEDFLYFYGGLLKNASAPTGVKFAEIIYQNNTLPVKSSYADSDNQFVIGYMPTGMGTMIVRGDASYMLKTRNDSTYQSGVNFRASVSDDNRYYVFGAFAGGAGLDGALVAGTTLGEGWTSATGMAAGSYKDINAYVYYGYICAYRLYNRVLTAAEIAQNYEQDKKRFGLATKTAYHLEDLFDALPTLVDETKNITVSSAQLAEASAETLAIATNKGWTVQ